MIFGAYCVGNVQYATLVVLRYLEHIVKVRYTICYLGSIMIFGAYCVGKVDNMLPSSIMINGAYCIVNAHNMLPW